MTGGNETVFKAVKTVILKATFQIISFNYLILIILLSI